MATEQQRPASQKLPAGLAGVLNPSEENRDSAYYSSTDASSKHTSAASGVGMSLFHAAQDKTPSPTTTHLLPQALVSPSSNMSVASMVSPTSPGSGRFDRPTSLESVPASVGPDSRRESVDSRMNQNFGELRLGSSPYASQNQSTASIQGNLAQQRHPRSGIDQLATHRISNGYQPSMERTPAADAAKTSRTAPAITGPATSTIARAAEPTKGQAWAFPEDEIQRVPSANPHMYDSRRSSVTDSIASSQFTTESRLPPGQRRLDDAAGSDYQRLSAGEVVGTDFQRLSASDVVGSDFQRLSASDVVGSDFQRLSATSSEYPSVHHHTLQHKQLSDLASEESSPHGGTQPYSRTPELRVSHKLAERKRRTEMKELFEQLRDLMPQERGSKASKWEILTKAIAEHQRQQDAIGQLSNHYQKSVHETDALRRELERLRVENSQLRGGVPNMPPAQAQASHPVPSQPASEIYTQDPYRASRPELPPLRALSGNLPNGPESMTGVQYEGQRPNGFHNDRF